MEKLTCRPNADTGSDVLGGSETRITWEVQSGADEALAGLSLTVPEGTTYETEDLRLTMLSGEDLMERTFIEPKIEQDGETLRLTFDEPAPAGRFFRLEVYGVVFPASGGSMQCAGTYTLADGSEHEVDGIPVVDVMAVTPFDQFKTYLEEQPWVQAWNSNTFLRLFLNPVLIVSSLPIIFTGFLMSLAIVLVAFPLAMPFGFMFALMRISKSRILRGIAAVYVNLIRGTPAFLQIYIAFFGLPLAGVNIDNYALGVIVMAMNSAAYLCEIFRAGIQSIPAGQSEAARSLGMSAAQTMVSIIIPQTFRNVIPTLTSEFILLYKDTSLLAAVGVMEIVMYAKTIVATTGSITPYVVAALFYLVVTLPLARVVSLLEARLTGATAGTNAGPVTKRPAKSAGTVVSTPPDHIAGL
ncbi:ABC transporter permease subunit [Collinsella phocaeensis]|uniref:ABC transporter permease subunit n=1 Tax=Collinsella phocaeensis TaxID=1871016 RepID=UPI001F075353|nr:ABC transporter permease subunit [Collinsella phocaeensis]